MAKSQAEQVRELTDTLTRADAQLQLLISRVAEQDEEIKRAARRDEEFIAKHAASDERIAQLRTEVTTLREELRRAEERLAISEAKNAALEERSRSHEKTSDRGWQLWLAALGFGFGLLSLLVTAALQLKK
jgi:chromosome segregation ATPase